MDDEPPEQVFQSFTKPKTLVFSFETDQQKSDFICELFSFKMEKAHFSLCLQKQNSITITIFSDSKKSIEESENRIKEMVYNSNHHEKNKWWFW